MKHVYNGIRLTNHRLVRMPPFIIAVTLPFHNGWVHMIFCHMGRIKTNATQQSRSSLRAGFKPVQEHMP